MENNNLSPNQKETKTNKVTNSELSPKLSFRKLTDEELKQINGGLFTNLPECIIWDIEEGGVDKSV